MHCADAAVTDLNLSALISEVKPGYCLPQAFYTDERIHAEDIRRVYHKQWLYVGHELQIPKPGDYFTYKIGNESLIITRHKDGTVHALHNVCRHRGSAICTSEKGHANKLVCPYHQWVFDHDGALLAARQMPENFERKNFGLKRAHVGRIEGLIFINLSENPPDFSQMQRDMSEFIKPHGLNNAKIAVVHKYDVQANWKLVVENSRECYHCHFGHPEYSALMLSRPNDKQHVQQCIALHEDRFAHYAKLGLRTKGAGGPSTTGPNYSVSRYPFAVQDAVCESEDRKLVAPVMGAFKDPDAGVCAGFHFPNFMFESSSDHFITFRYDAVSARRSSIEVMWFVRADAVEGRDYDVSKLTWFWKTTGEQDWKLAEDNQAGINSAFYEPGPYAPEEMGGPTWLLDWYVEQLKQQ